MCRRLKKLDISDNENIPASLGKAKPDLGYLKETLVELKFDNSDVTSDWFKEIFKCKRLEILSLSRNPRITQGIAPSTDCVGLINSLVELRLWWSCNLGENDKKLSEIKRILRFTHGISV